MSDAVVLSGSILQNRRRGFKELLELLASEHETVLVENDRLRQAEVQRLEATGSSASSGSNSPTRSAELAVSIPTGLDLGPATMQAEGASLSPLSPTAQRIGQASDMPPRQRSDESNGIPDLRPPESRHRSTSGDSRDSRGPVFCAHSGEATSPGRPTLATLASGVSTIEEDEDGPPGPLGLGGTRPPPLTLPASTIPSALRGGSSGARRASCVAPRSTSSLTVSLAVPGAEAQPKVHDRSGGTITSLSGSPGSARVPGSRMSLKEGLTLHEAWNSDQSMMKGRSFFSNFRNSRTTFMTASPGKSPSGRQQTPVEVQFGKSPTTYRAGDAIQNEESFLQRFVSRPNCARRITWDLLSFLMMTYDMLVIPLQVYSLPASTIALVMERTTTAFWTSDLFLTFMVGYNDLGVVEMRPSRIAVRYIKTWFPIDLLVVLVDWFLIVFNDDSVAVVGMLRMGKSLRIARVLRIFRLLRIVKVMSLLAELNDYVGSESMVTAIGIAKMIVAITLVNHFLACGWYGLAQVVYDHGPHIDSWVKTAEAFAGDQWDFSYAYTTSMHWSLTQFTPASMEVVPENVYERSYALCVILFALVSFSSFVSSITSAMTHLRKINGEQTRQMELVRRYITDNQVSMDLGNRLFSFIRQHRRSSKKRVHEMDVPAFVLMPESLRVQLHGEVFRPVLLPHPFFEMFNEVDDVGLANVCHQAMSERAYLLGQEIFAAGDEATEMLFLRSGGLRYYFCMADSESPQGRQTDIVAGIENNHICEMPLWVQWEHRGQLLALGGSAEFVVLDSELFRSIACRSDCVSGCKAYARHFAERVLMASGGEDKLSDLFFSHDLVQEMAKEAFSDSLPIAEAAPAIAAGRKSFFNRSRTQEFRKLMNSVGLGHDDAHTRDSGNDLKSVMPFSEMPDEQQPPANDK